MQKEGLGKRMNPLPHIFKESEFYKQGKEVVKSLGVVFGDIGTSPIYTLSVIFLLIQPTVENVLGVLSLIVWTLFILVMLEYAWLAMSLGKKGEGGTIVLREILIPVLRSPGQISFVTILSFAGIALFLGDGVITPAMSILSAVEGILLIPGCKNFDHYVLILIACIITIGLFILQRKGTERVSVGFGPLMFIWFIVLAYSGFIAILQAPMILNAINPMHAIKFIFSKGLTGFLVLSGVILCATGGEALYADMGHLGRKPILRAWYFVFGALLLTYLGQGAFFLKHPNTKSVLYEMILDQAPIYMYIPFLILSLIATVIASQAMISGIFSIVYQGITTKIMPMFKIDYTSSKLRSQVYISTVNWILMVAVLIIIVQFKNSHNLAAAYGFAVTGTMTITGIMMSWIFWHRNNFIKMIVAGFVTLYGVMFFISNVFKIPHGGYWSIIIALCPFSLILIYTFGQRKMKRSLQPMLLEMFLEQYETVYAETNKIAGSALFFVRDITTVPPHVVQTIVKNNILYEDNIFISVVTRDDPFGVIGFFKGDLAPGFRVFEIHMGYMEVLDIEKILSNAGIEPKVMFYGLEEIVTSKVIWKIYAMIKRVSPSFVQFYKLPVNKLHGITTSVEM